MSSSDRTGTRINADCRAGSNILGYINGVTHRSNNISITLGSRRAPDSKYWVRWYTRCDVQYSERLGGLLGDSFSHIGNRSECVNMRRTYSMVFGDWM